MEAMQPYRAVAVCRLACRLQAAGYSRLHLRTEVASEGPPGFARSRGGDARHLKQSGCCGDDGVVEN